MRTYNKENRRQKLITGYRPVVRAREGSIFGIRHPQWCFDVMVEHYDRDLGLSDARILPFNGMVDCGPPPDPARLRDIERICD